MMQAHDADIFYAQLNSGDVYRPTKASRENTERIRSIVKDYPETFNQEDILQYLDNLSPNLSD